MAEATCHHPTVTTRPCWAALSARLLQDDATGALPGTILSWAGFCGWRRRRGWHILPCHGCSLRAGVRVRDQAPSRVALRQSRSLQGLAPDSPTLAAWGATGWEVRRPRMEWECPSLQTQATPSSAVRGHSRWDQGWQGLTQGACAA